MEIKEEKKEIIEKQNPSLNEIISSNNEINPNQISYNQTSTTIETSLLQNQTNSKIDFGENDITNINTDEKENLEEDTQSTIKITNRIIKASPGQKFYEKKVISKIITKDSPTETTIIKTSNILNEKNKSQNHNKATYTRPLQKGKGKGKGKMKNTQNNNKNKKNLPKINLIKKPNLNSNLNMMHQSSRNSNYKTENSNSNNNILAASQSFAGNKLYLNKPEIENAMPHTYRAHSPQPGPIKRKTINRGEEIKNVQITHIICSTKPSSFHITEKLETNNIKSNPIQILKSDREKLKRVGKTSFTSSCQDNVKPIIQNLKGKTTIYQHARGIGMTNDRKGNINPLFYNSEIKKLEPIVKEKEKVKVEYVENFRSNKYRNGENNKINSTRIINNGNNAYQYKNYKTEVINNRNVINSSRANMNYEKKDVKE